MAEDKKQFVEMLGELLRDHTRERVESLVYVELTNSNREIVTIVFANGSMKHVDVTADSCLAIMHDIYKALC